MEKKIEDYLHLYHPQSGLRLSMNDGRIGKYEGITSSMVVKVFIDGGFIDSYFGEFKPILRPLSDITEEEVKERYWGSKRGFELVMQSSSPQTQPPRWYADDFLWLLSKHFDLFGLIDAGLAISTPTITPSKK